MLPKPTMLKAQPWIIERRQSWRALRTSSIDVPSIEPERSTRNTISHGACAPSKRGANATATAVSPLSSRSIQAWGASKPAAAIASTKSRSSAASTCDSDTVAAPASIAIDTGCEGDSILESAVSASTRTDNVSPYGTVHASGGLSASASGRPTPVQSCAGA